MNPKLKLVINYIIIITLSLLISKKFVDYPKENVESIKIDYYNIKNGERMNFGDEQILFFNKMFWNNMIAIFIFANILFIFTLIVDSINNIDLSWGLMFFYLINFNYLSMEIIFNKINFSFLKFFENKSFSILIIIPVFLFSVKHIFFVLRGFKGFDKNEVDFRYQEYNMNEINISSKNNDNENNIRIIKNWFAIYFNFHFMNCFIIGLIVYPIIESFIFYTFNFFDFKDFILFKMQGLIFLFGFILSMIGIILETVADEQLTNFRGINLSKKNEKKQKLIFEGLWKFSRHPNYFGEILFYWTLILLNYSLIGIFHFHNLIGALIMTSVFLTYSIPVMENHMLIKYPNEYNDYIKKVPTKLIPFIF